jgi:hypothetical protein
MAADGSGIFVHLFVGITEVGAGHLGQQSGRFCSLTARSAIARSKSRSVKEASSSRP